jgi:calmodulin
LNFLQDELKTAMELMGETLTDQDIDNMIALADLNKDGKIDYEGK